MAKSTTLAAAHLEQIKDESVVAHSLIANLERIAMPAMAETIASLKQSVATMADDAEFGLLSLDGAQS